jgi:hypothetical protein
VYIIEYADGAAALIGDLHGVPLSHSDREVLERLAPGSTHTVADAHDEGMTLTRLPDAILTRNGCSHRLGWVISTLQSAYGGHEGPRFATRPNLRFVSVID